MAMDISEAAVDAVLADGEAFVVDAHEVENGGVEIVAVSGAFGGLEGELVALAV